MPAQAPRFRPSITLEEALWLDSMFQGMDLTDEAEEAKTLYAKLNQFLTRIDIGLSSASVRKPSMLESLGGSSSTTTGKSILDLTPEELEDLATRVANSQTKAPSIIDAESNVWFTALQKAVDIKNGVPPTARVGANTVRSLPVSYQGIPEKVEEWREFALVEKEPGSAHERRWAELCEEYRKADYE